MCQFSVFVLCFINVVILLCFLSMYLDHRSHLILLLLMATSYRICMEHSRESERMNGAIDQSHVNVSPISYRGRRNKTKYSILELCTNLGTKIGSKIESDEIISEVQNRSLTRTIFLQ